MFTVPPFVTNLLLAWGFHQARVRPRCAVDGVDDEFHWRGRGRCLVGDGD